MAAAVCGLCVVAALAQAQEIRWGRGSSKAEVERSIRRVEIESDRFKSLFDHALDHTWPLVLADSERTTFLPAPLTFLHERVNFPHGEF